MDSKTFDSYVNHETLSPVYYKNKDEEDNCIIDLGLSLRALQPQPYDPSPNDEYGDLISWHDMNQIKFSENFEDGSREEQSKAGWGYVKVNMEGGVVGRKICLFDHTNYSTLALLLEDMFGGQTISGIRLFQNGSHFLLFYKDTNENWRNVGDVPWKEFLDSVKRLRIVRKSEDLPPFP